MITRKVSIHPGWWFCRYPIAPIIMLTIAALDYTMLRRGDASSVCKWFSNRHGISGERELENFHFLSPYCVHLFNETHWPIKNNHRYYCCCRVFVVAHVEMRHTQHRMKYLLTNILWVMKKRKKKREENPV